MSRRIYPDILTLEDCLRFKEEHPDLKRKDLIWHYRKMYDGMKSLGCLDELYPHARGNKPKVATLEECIKFKAEHPDMTRRGVHQRHTAFYNAMKRLGCLDELYPKHIGGYTHTLTLDDCLRFKQEHPNMSRYDLMSRGQVSDILFDVKCMMLEGKGFIFSFFFILPHVTFDYVEFRHDSTMLKQAFCIESSGQVLDPFNDR